MKPKSTSLAIVTKDPVATAVIPKPTRAEIIEAMTRIRCEELRKQQADEEEQITLLKEQCEKALLRHLKSIISKTQPTVRFGTEGYEYVDHQRVFNGKITGVEVEYSLRDLPEEIEAKLVRLSKLKESKTRFTMEAVRNQIRSGFTGTPEDRVQALLSHPQARASLEAAVKQMSAK